VNANIKLISPVTAIYEIGRAKADGRRFSDYLDWLEKTSQIFPALTIYCEKVPNLQGRKIDGNWVEKAFSDFSLNCRRDEIFKICEYFKRKNSDVTFQLPDYAILQFSKFEMLEDAMLQNFAKNFLWLDAGISRFINPATVKFSRFEQSLLPNILDAVNEGLFEVDLRKNLRWGKLKKVKIGSCRRSFSGTSFLVKSEHVSDYKNVLLSKAFEWISLGIWDNEQVALNAVFLEGLISPDLINQSGDTGTLGRVFTGEVVALPDLIYSSKELR
jgi:hypothetical protein